MQADWFFVPGIDVRSGDEQFAKGFQSAYGDPRLIEATTPAAAPNAGAELASEGT